MNLLRVIFLPIGHHRCVNDLFVLHLNNWGAMFTAAKAERILREVLSRVLMWIAWAFLQNDEGDKLPSPGFKTQLSRFLFFILACPKLYLLSLWLTIYTIILRALEKWWFSDSELQKAIWKLSFNSARLRAIMLDGFTFWDSGPSLLVLGVFTRG